MEYQIQKKSKIHLFQLKDRLFVLRNQISRKTPCEPWENILQGPIIQEILERKPKNIKEWKEIPLISAKYRQHARSMDRQIKDFWQEIQRLLDSVDWKK